VGPDLTTGKWLWGDGSFEAITQTITKGVPEPKEHLGVMPPMGGVQLSQADIAAVAASVWAVTSGKSLFSRKGAAKYLMTPHREFFQLSHTPHGTLQLQVTDITYLPDRLLATRA
jgi:hypothetical protein